MYFQVDDRIAASSIFIENGPLSSIYLKNDATFPWIILVPRQENVQEIYQLSDANRYILMNEITELSTIMQVFFKPDKLNIGALGNIVSQLHIHIVARFKTDKLWPEGIWQSTVTSVPYTSIKITELTDMLREKILNSSFGRVVV